MAFFLLNFLSKFIDMYCMDTVLPLIVLAFEMLKIPKTKVEARFLKKRDFVTNKCLALGSFENVQGQQKTFQNTQRHSFHNTQLCAQIFLLSYIFYKAIPVSELYWLTRCIAHVSNSLVNSKIIYVMHLLMLKRLTLHFTNPLVNIVLKFYVVSLTSCNFNVLKVETQTLQVC